MLARIQTLGHWYVGSELGGLYGTFQFYRSIFDYLFYSDCVFARMDYCLSAAMLLCMFFFS